MAFLIGGAIIGGVGALAGGMISANAQKSAAAKASDANLRMAGETNAQNERLFRESRGGMGADGFGHALLPSYFGSGEQDAGNAAMAQFQRLMNAIPQLNGRISGIQSQLAPALQSSLGYIKNQYNGQDLQDRIMATQPLFDQRQAAARSMNSGIDTGLLQALGQLNAQRQGQGFLGGSTFDRNRMANAFIGARQAGAANLGQVNVQNAGDLAGLRMQDITNRANPGSLFGAMQGATGFETMPYEAMAGLFQNAQSPLNMFRMNPQAFQATGMPSQNPNLTGTGIGGSALSSLGQTGMNYFLQQNLMRQYLAQQPQMYGATPGGGYSFGTMAPSSGFSNTNFLGAGLFGSP